MISDLVWTVDAGFLALFKVAPETKLSNLHIILHIYVCTFVYMCICFLCITFVFTAKKSRIHELSYDPVAVAYQASQPLKMNV